MKTSESNPGLRIDIVWTADYLLKSHAHHVLITENWIFENMLLCALIQHSSYWRVRHVLVIKAKFVKVCSHVWSIWTIWKSRSVTDGDYISWFLGQLGDDSIALYWEVVQRESSILFSGVSCTRLSTFLRCYINKAHAQLNPVKILVFWLFLIRFLYWFLIKSC